jgi:hypothetical protein
MGMQVATSITPEILDTARSICANGGIEGFGPPNDNRVIDLPFHWPSVSKVERQNAAFYRISVEEKHCQTGFFLACKSSNKSKFKLILFDKEGAVIYQEESTSHQTESVTSATMFFTVFDTYRLVDTNPSDDKSSPSLFSRLDTFCGSKRSLQPGQYLVAVYGDNFLSKTNFQLALSLSKNDDHGVSFLRQKKPAIFTFVHNGECFVSRD